MGYNYPINNTTQDIDMNLDTDLKDLHIKYHDTTEFRNYSIKVEQDDMTESPREWDNLGTMVYWHRNYNLGDVDGSKEYNHPRDLFVELSGLEFEDPDYLTDEQYQRCVDVANERNIILPLYLYDHSGITMNTSGFSCGWDSGQVGHIYVSHKTIQKEYGVKRVSQKMREKVAGYLRGEVETLDHYITGSVYWYSVTKEDIDGEEIDIDSCGGYYGYYTDDDNYMVNEIKGAIQYDIEHTPQQKDLFN